ncbi:guanine nucleotide-binding protein G(I)/G(S)/G(O) subunit gamma-4 isoform X1 [Carcharodon carcharias]|uniref:guanine nucleotide-binding protein G(I)/G(S)/G(O) subunit gamma-4 isoform X1 n=1 Tax=Carcharodon carcharias TaxID=13397 RepID=UPI001B7E281F|nr:guanine nucleotide-binding protein G(I)/G(S)/G(O) subunit gamma-4 isoform X1 [Carcharodon carcharias]XP_041044044.1 guanine nucleotide-binding protein G(I)/G(S)/G(O) subunit gamma-4 isoform X1 [Carcharodon carcharias]XP_041044045.1 guanine nucleotide-binding protein G(I)/G(S)/G(O) subunit gamma-4 isoform X1 [Carcharodon carcharias]XP_041044046.1 guanine nucleotide-binding protein G(I)/G(S)/G(O) subunit gamma-4 isoform X1 [Carcharodon carcharias]XP_041044048.1 guanine nucleotide-binding prote
MSNNSTASISQARKAVEQLKMEACMERMKVSTVFPDSEKWGINVWIVNKVSKASADLMAYCDAHLRDDPLIAPLPASENPFREKKLFCIIL